MLAQRFKCIVSGALILIFLSYNLLLITVEMPVCGGAATLPCACAPSPAAAVPACPRVPYNLTTCGGSAHRRGLKQRVVAFTFFQQDTLKAKENRNYFQGILENLELMKALYPGFVMRLYYQVDQTDVLQRLCSVYCNNLHEMDLCPAVDNPRLGNMSRLYPLIWRFLPSIDPQVDLFLSRDLDSRLSEREQAAVNQFLDSASMIHVMRDNPNHGTSMMGGMWGTKLNRTVRAKFKESFRAIFKDGIAYANRSLGGWDQIALRRYVWPWAKKMAYAHDSYTCKKFSYTHPFPTQRLPGVGNYVGSIVSLNASVKDTCPEKCRPQEHKDWTFC